MVRWNSACAALLLAGAVGPAASACAEEIAAPCRLCAADRGLVDDKPAAPVSLDVSTSLDFDRLILSGHGLGGAEIAPDGGRIATGSVASIGSRAMAGEVIIRGEPGRVIRVELPSSIELYGMSGGSLLLESIRSDLQSLPRLDRNGVLRVRFGGSVRIVGDADGEFRGKVPVEVDYL